jgi:thiol-disulfide isomerase/thioredoxin
VSLAEHKGFISPRRRVAPLKPEPGNPAPEFTLKDADGKDVSLKDLRGKVTVLTFWASWCGYCKKALPDIQKLHEEFAGKPVAIYGVNCREKDGTNKAAKDILTQGKYTFPVLFNGDGASTLYDVQGYPTLYVVGPDGKIVHKIRGAQANLANTLRPIIEGAMKKS